ncbi:hypothetical protein IJG79_00430 [Candidatus Saccharibacteria bacterium]|nr:hypothetical protein [Candidatus Saccharibacteria bacterium]
MDIKKLLKPQYGIAIAPLIFAFSQIIILGYNWIFGGRFGDISLTVSKYVGLSVWSSILFAICNFVIGFLMVRYYLYAYKNLSKLWLILGFVQLFGFIGLSIFPHAAFLDSNVKETVVNLHIGLARIMFFAMFGMALERLRIAASRDNRNKFAARVCLAFLIYGIVYVIGYFIKDSFLWQIMLIWETGYIYAFMGMLILTRK